MWQLSEEVPTWMGFPCERPLMPNTLGQMLLPSGEMSPSVQVLTHTCCKKLHMGKIRALWGQGPPLWGTGLLRLGTAASEGASVRNRAATKPKGVNLVLLSTKCHTEVTIPVQSFAYSTSVMRNFFQASEQRCVQRFKCRVNKMSIHL